MTCEDFPCCGHESGCCPDFDDSGRQLNMICVCGAKLPITARYSICSGCMQDPDDPDYYPFIPEDYFQDEIEEDHYD